MTAPTCPDCGTALPADSPQSLCPACLLRQALASRTVVNGDTRSSSKPPPTPEEIADKFPQFEILECLGRGGMGVVYKARQKSLNRLVAIKILAPDREHEPHFAERFAREAELLARLNHPHIVTIHDFGETGGLFYLVMEHVDGVNLRDLLRDGKLEPKQALAIVPPICEALQYAHDKGIVHRDIKPENLLLDREGRIKIADFGIAALMGTDGENAGTPPYMAPEQGGDQTGIDHRADLYALGVVLYEMLTGERPGKDLIAPSRKVQIDVRLDEMVLRALEKQPERRYQTAGEFRTVVETLQTPDKPARAVVPPLPAATTEAPGPFKRFWWLFLVMPPVCALLGLGLGFIWAEFVPKIYEARTVVQLAPSGQAQQPNEWVVWSEAFRSQESLQRVSERLDLAQTWTVPQWQAEQKLRAAFELRQIRGTDLLELAVRLKSPTEAASIANELIRVNEARAAERGIGRNMFIVHEEAVPPRHPVSPNRPLLLGIFAAAGLGISPLVAMLLIVLMGRTQRGPGSASDSKPGPLARFLLLFSTIAFPAGLLGAVLGWLLGHFMPNLYGSGTLARNLALIGILLSPLAALSVMFFQSRRAGGVYDPASKPSKRWILVSQLSMVILVVIGKSWLVPVNSSSESERTLIGRAKFNFEIPQEQIGWGAELPVYEGETSRWFPSSGQSFLMKDGRNLYLRVHTMAPENGSPKLFVGISENGTDWTSESAEMGPSRRSTSLDLDHGIKATLQWNPATPPVSEANPRPVNALRTNSGLSVMTGIVFVVLLLGGILLVIILIARSRSRGAKAAVGIGCVVLLFGGLLLAVASVVLFSFTKPVMRAGPPSIPVQSPAPSLPPALLPEVEAEANGNDANEALKSIAINVTGAVARPGFYQLRADATLLDALAAAGGWTENAKLDEISINSGGNGAKHDILKILDGSEPNPALSKGHNVFVARRKP